MLLIELQHDQACEDTREIELVSGATRLICMMDGQTGAKVALFASDKLPLDLLGIENSLQGLMLTPTVAL